MDQFILTPGQYGRLIDGAQITLLVLFFAFLLGVVLSVVVGVLRLNSKAWVRGAALVFVEFFRGISSIILIFIVAIAIPIFLGVDQGNLIALGSIALGVNMGGYGAEIIRGAILSVPKGQTEASIALNLTEFQRLRFIVLPQAMRVILPPMGNLTIEILKGTALVSTVGVTELTTALTRINNTQISTASDRVPYLMLAFNVLVMYFVMSAIIAAIFRAGERYFESQYEGGPAAPKTSAVSTTGAG